VLIESPGDGGSLNHLGVEVGTTEVVVAETRRLAAEGLPTHVQDGTTCCYALQDKVWVDGPAGHRWEIYTVLADAGADLEGQVAGDRTLLHESDACCAPAADGATAEAACC
jgi:hypothetical protein